MQVKEGGKAVGQPAQKSDWVSEEKLNKDLTLILIQRAVNTGLFNTSMYFISEIPQSMYINIKKPL